MQWLIALETDDDPITTCRLMNIFRRKGLKLETLAMASQPAGYSLLALVEFSETELGHIFNYLRRTEGVEHVTCYRHGASADASFVFVDANSQGSSVAEVLRTFPGCKLIFASHGKYLLEIAADLRPSTAAPGLGDVGVLPFARVLTTGRALEAVTVNAE